MALVCSSGIATSYSTGSLKVYKIPSTSNSLSCRVQSLALECSMSMCIGISVGTDIGIGIKYVKV